MSQLNELSITLQSPVTTSGSIARVKINVERGLPADAIFKTELTNNANDPVPVWEDATSAVLGDRNYVFTNNHAANGYAFNLRVTAKRGPSGQSGYVGKITGSIGADVAMKLLNSVHSSLRIDDMRRQITHNTEAIIDDKSQFAPQTSTAPIAQINAALGGAPLGVTARFVAAQECEGDPSPGNARAITGRGAALITKCAENLWNNETWAQTVLANAGGSPSLVTVDKRRCLRASNTSVYDICKLLTSVGPRYKPGARYTTQAYFKSVNPPTSSSGACGLRIEHTDGTYVHTFVRAEDAQDDFTRAQLTSTAGKTVKSIFLTYGTTAPWYVDLDSMCITEGTSAAFYPFVGKSHLVTLPAPLYGLPGAEDEIDLTRGIITKRTKLLTLTGGEDWGEYRTNDWTATYVRFFARGSVSGTDALLSGLSTHLKRGSATSAGYWPNTFLTHTNGYLYTAVEIAGVTDLDTWVAYLAAQHAAGTPVQVLYELAEPQILTIPPVLIPSLLGENNVYTDGGGDTTVNWRMDMQPAIDALQAQITALQALLTQP